MTKTDTFILPEKSKSESLWESCTFEQLASKLPLRGKAYKVKNFSYLFSLYKEIVRSLGNGKGSLIFFKVIIWDIFFNRPKWFPDRFHIENNTQENFYNNKFKEYRPVITFFQVLTKTMGEKSADRLIAKTMVPVVLEMMQSKYHSVQNIDSVEIWLGQARDYLGKEIEKDKGFSGTIHIARDKSELRFHVTRCAPMQILREYGMIYTAAALCMCDHITYHTVFPNLIFKRTHTLAIGDDFCDHEFRIRKESDPIIDEDNYSDCNRDPEIRELVREWEEKQKIRYDACDA
jgi:hypothetical protein